MKNFHVSAFYQSVSELCKQISDHETEISRLRKEIKELACETIMQEFDKQKGEIKIDNNKMTWKMMKKNPHIDDGLNFEMSRFKKKKLVIKQFLN